MARRPKLTQEMVDEAIRLKADGLSNGDNPSVPAIPLKVLEVYLAVDPHALDYERTDAARESFCSVVRNAVVPLHQIAMNQGFGIWSWNSGLIL